MTEVSFTAEGMADIRNDSLLSINKDTEKHVPKSIDTDTIYALLDYFIIRNAKFIYLCIFLSSPLSLPSLGITNILTKYIATITKICKRHSKIGLNIFLVFFSFSRSLFLCLMIHSTSMG